ncbi:hypothetical protein BDB00DRAFT_618770 [Zychaea mexicana]|uniref:uncharacterized protein n=1 Tax=Zychaea mexicana TaxID=64656 RepID=UPI0022FDB41E|nr:uncharacterized protein BDB00DRAFT_618770 [Zychaea mexicana]KAI9489356.1 hypothetical protein BDB00DRAFT_618770 [Zychaea mexicana]
MSSFDTANERVGQIAAHLAKAGSSLTDKVCIVTGANSIKGIGRATVYALAKRGPKVIFATDLRGENLEELARDIEMRYPNVACIARAFDAASTEGVTNIVAEAMEMFGRLDVYFANAGMSLPRVRLEDADESSFMEVVRVNSLSAFLALKIAGKAMEETGKGGKEMSGGSIICTASVAGIRSGAGPPEYSAAKSAVINLCQTSAYQYAGTNVRTNAICPGIIETGMTVKTFDYAKSRGSSNKIGQLNPTRRYAVPSEVAAVVAFLASEEASYINGQAIAVDGGLSASLPVVPGRFM